MEGLPTVENLKTGKRAEHLKVAEVWLLSQIPRIFAVSERLRLDPTLEPTAERR